MLQITVPSVSANNLQISLPVHLQVYTSVSAYYSMETTDLQVVTPSNTLQDEESVY